MKSHYYCLRKISSCFTKYSFRTSNSSIYYQQIRTMSTNQYNDWTKEELIKRIEDLEKYPTNSLKKSPSISSIASSTAPTLAASESNMEMSQQIRGKKKKKQMDFSKYSTRKIALRFAYIGWAYHGLAVQANADPEEVPTVEQKILEAMYTTKLIPTMNVADFEFSRCGRTDRGVSALRQVISLRVRSNLSKQDQKDPSMDDRELDYLHILNNLLPNDIRFYEISLRPGDDFDARFSCLSRRYKYFFHVPKTEDNANSLDVHLMNEAAKLFVGEHDFRNFCKVDGSKQLTNFHRGVIASEIKKHEFIDELYYFDLTGTAFLWHQVRSMIAILLLVGQKLEPMSIVSDLLNMGKTPRRPVYEMAADYPLVLYDCQFPPNIEWLSFKNAETLERTNDKLYNFWHEQWLKTAMVGEFLQMVETSSTNKYDSIFKEEKVFVNTGDGKSKPTARYQPLSYRSTLDPPEIVNQRWLDKKIEKKQQLDTSSLYSVEQ